MLLRVAFLCVSLFVVSQHHTVVADEDVDLTDIIDEFGGECTMCPNNAAVPDPDKRLDLGAELAEEGVPSTCGEFSDLLALVGGIGEIANGTECEEGVATLLSQIAIDLPAYCDCPGVSRPQNSCPKLCEGAAVKEDVVIPGTGGATCGQTNTLLSFSTEAFCEDPDLLEAEFTEGLAEVRSLCCGSGSGRTSFGLAFSASTMIIGVLSIMV